MARLYTKKEVSILVGVSVRQLDYWAKDQLNIVPKPLGEKYTNVQYTMAQVIDLMISLHLKNQGFDVDCILSFLPIIRRKDCLLNKTYIIKLSEKLIQKIDNYNEDNFNTRLITKSDDVYYVIISKDELNSFIDKFVELNLKKLEIEKINIPNKTEMIEELKQNALIAGIEIPDVA